MREGSWLGVDEGGVNSEEDVDVSGGYNSAYCSRDRLVATSAMALVGIWDDKNAGC